MVTHIRTVAFQGVDVAGVNVQVQTSSGLPAFNIVGLPDKAIAESKERIRASFHSIGLALPPKRITINLAPADVQKEGSHYDLPMALGLLAEMDIIDSEDLGNYIILGELGLDGSIAAVHGVLASTIEAIARGFGLICPEACGAEATWAGSCDILASPNLLSLINHFKGTQVLSPPQKPEVFHKAVRIQDMKDIKGQYTAKRALEVAAAGGHNMLMLGSPGGGKSMLASRLPGILPPLNSREALEVSMIHSLAGILPEGGLVRNRPFRDPHHSASLPALVGGGHKSKPGEISLAHRGVLFLDELPEFAGSTLEALRQPLETGKVTVARVNAHVTYPARIQLIAAMNPCRCGYFGDKERECNRAPRCAEQYLHRISGPLLDRFDIVIEVPEVKVQELMGYEPGESTAEISTRVTKVREIQHQRYQGKEIMINAEVDGEELMRVASLREEAQGILTKAVEKFKMSARGYNRVLRVARTIADMDGSDAIDTVHVAEAISYRRAIR